MAAEANPQLPDALIYHVRQLLLLTIWHAEGVAVGDSKKP